MVLPFCATSLVFIPHSFSTVHAGTYTVFFNVTVAGQFEMSITESGEHIEGSPMPYTIEPGPVDVAECLVTGIPQGKAAVGQPIQISITARDRFRNASPPKEHFQVHVVAPNKQTTKLHCQAVSSSVFLYALTEVLTDVPTHTHFSVGGKRCSFTPAEEGAHDIRIHYGNVPLVDSPYLVMVV